MTGIPQSADVIRHSFVVMFHGPYGGAVELWLFYQKNDPCSLYFALSYANQHSIWTVSREVVAECVIDGKMWAGGGDFEISEPDESDTRTGIADHFIQEPLTRMLFRSFEEETEEEPYFAFASQEVLREFVSATFACVPRGEERYDVDSLIDQLLERK